MFDIQLTIMASLSMATFYFMSQNITLNNKIENLEEKLAYNKALYESNKTKTTEFNNSVIEIEKDYNETVNTFNNTPVHGVIDFGLHR